MYGSTERKAAELAKELMREIDMLEAELSHKKDLLVTLSKIGGVSKIGRPRRKPGPKPKSSVAMKGKPGRKPKATGRRRSKNRDAVLEAAGKLGSKFTLAELKDMLQRKDPKFGGKYASATILAVLKTTPEIKKVKRGLYTYKG
jgi:hypothetical protein